MTEMLLSKPSSRSWTPRSYQRVAVKFLLEHACAGLFLKPGLGKTSSTLAALKILFKQKVAKKVLIIAPLRVCYDVWPMEVKRWADFNHFTVEVLHGPHKDEALARKADIYVTNFEGLEWLLDAEKTKYEVKGRKTKRTKVVVDVKRFERLGFDTLVVDELSKFKNHDSDRFKTMKPVLGTFARRWGLTGSPTANGLMDLFGQCLILDQGRSLGSFITHFRHEFFVPDAHNKYEWHLKEGGEARIHERISPLVLEMGDELLDMPDLIENEIKVTLPPKAFAEYLKLERDLILSVEQGLVTAATAASASMKCRQVANGGIYLDAEILENGLKVPASQRKTAHIHNAKTEALQELVEELQHSPLLVAYDFGHDLERLRKAFPKGVFACDYSAKQFSSITARWNDGDIPVLFGHPQSIGHGLNLQEGPGHNVCWHSLTWDFDVTDQFNRRVYRSGNKSKKVFIHYLIGEGTIDEVVLLALRAKDHGQRAFFSALKALHQKRRS